MNSLCECFLFEELQPSLTIANGGGWSGQAYQPRGCQNHPSHPVRHRDLRLLCCHQATLQ